MTTELTCNKIFDKVMGIGVTARILDLKTHEDWYAFQTHEEAVDFLASYAAHTAWLLQKCNNDTLLNIYNKITELFEEKTKICTEDFMEDPAVSYIYYCYGPLVLVELNKECLETY